MTNKKFRKVKKWSEHCFSPDENWNDKKSLIFGFFCMIPVIGQILWIVLLIDSLVDREVYWEEIK